MRCWCWAIWWATAPIRTPSSTACAASAPAAIVRGNHDKVAAGLDDAEDFNPMAKAAAHWTRDALTPQNLEYLRDLPAGPLIVDGAIEICHGSPLDEDLYVVADIDAARSIAAARAAICLFGHTHVALTARMDGQRRLEIEAPQGHPEFEITHRRRLEVPDQSRARSDSPATAMRAPRMRLRTSIASVVTLYRVAYPIEAAQKKILDAGLPPMLAYRLGMGR